MKLSYFVCGKDAKYLAFVLGKPFQPGANVIKLILSVIYELS